MATLLLSLGGKTFLETKKLSPWGKNLTIAPVKLALKSETTQKFHLGFRNALAGLVWIDLMQSSSDTPVTDDRVSWEYSRVDNASELDPRFLDLYKFGSTYLSVLRQDKLGAKLILEKWIGRQPHYWRPHHQLGFHLFSEFQDYAEASKHILVAASLPGAPAWLSSLGVRLLSETGANQLALKMAGELFTQLSDPEGKLRLVKRIRSLNYWFQEQAWHHAVVEFKNINSRAPKANLELLPYVASQGRELSSIAVDLDYDPELFEILGEKYKFEYDPARDIIRSVSPKEQFMGLELTGIYRKENK